MESFAPTEAPNPTVPQPALPSLPYERIKLVFTDLDGTLYPGFHEEEPVAEKPALLRNMAEVVRLEALGVPVVPATGNNVGCAQKKMLDPRTGRNLRDLSKSPGIYCNGGLVKGAGGVEVDVRHLGAFIPTFVDKWCGGSATAGGQEGGGNGLPPRHHDIVIGGLAKDNTIFLRWPGLSPANERTACQFTTLMMMDEHDYQWLSPEEFVAAGESVLSLLILMPVGWDPAMLLTMQSWLHGTGLLLFDDPAGRCANGEGEGVVCKHVHVPGIGPEIDISPSGVNKGSAIMRLLQDANTNLGVDCSTDGSEIAVFGDAGNDVELFGMQRNRTGEVLEPLGLGYRPAIRCAMPWANDKLLLKDSNVVATVDVVLAQFATGAVAVESVATAAETEAKI